MGLLVVAAAAACVGLTSLGTFLPLPNVMEADPRVVSAAPGQVAVIDGDTLRVDGTIVRLSGVQALPRGQSCPAGPDCGGQATAVLASLVSGKRVECRLSGRDPAGRPAGSCAAGGQDVNVALVATGWARASNAVLDAAELDARTHKRGIWLTH